MIRFLPDVYEVCLVKRERNRADGGWWTGEGRGGEGRGGGQS
jgi:hypothetical protein